MSIVKTQLVRHDAEYAVRFVSVYDRVQFLIKLFNVIQAECPIPIELDHTEPEDPSTTTANATTYLYVKDKVTGNYLFRFYLTYSTASATLFINYYLPATDAWQLVADTSAPYTWRTTLVYSSNAPNIYLAVYLKTIKTANALIWGLYAQAQGNYLSCMLTYLQKLEDAQVDSSKGAIMIDRGGGTIPYIHYSLSALEPATTTNYFGHAREPRPSITEGIMTLQPIFWAGTTYLIPKCYMSNAYNDVLGTKVIETDVGTFLLCGNGASEGSYNSSDSYYHNLVIDVTDIASEL